MWQQRLLNELYLTLKKAEEIALALDLAPKQEVGIQSIETTPSEVKSTQRQSMEAMKLRMPNAIVMARNMKRQAENEPI